MEREYPRKTAFESWLADRAAGAQELDGMMPEPPSSSARWAACETVRIYHQVGNPLNPHLAQTVAAVLYIDPWDVVDAFQQQ
ncbi:hypothetical protein CG740_38990 [Streptomyces sp. CB01201]|uniref:hypothetical protein n=1 Tax=Streptomyces sp. CB01201 TaxID=2020324 RepID=UPI000C276056|nr:hypothetical protein [Streptomyces sp. CB01201]PJM97831.1 hypothetical protein CG740_38990 [Streptomyces sp. CB01201]